MHDPRLTSASKYADRVVLGGEVPASLHSDLLSFLNLLSWLSSFERHWSSQSLAEHERGRQPECCSFHFSRFSSPAWDDNLCVRSLNHYFHYVHVLHQALTVSE
jgi:hypothetical protein